MPVDLVRVVRQSCKWMTMVMLNRGNSGSIVLPCKFAIHNTIKFRDYNLTCGEQPQKLDGNHHQQCVLIWNATTSVSMCVPHDASMSLPISAGAKKTLHWNMHAQNFDVI